MSELQKEYEALGVLALIKRLEALERQIRRLEARQDPSNWQPILGSDASGMFTVQAMQFIEPDPDTEEFKD